MEELEEALRESVKITAQREMVMVEQEAQIEYQEKQVGDASWEITLIPYKEYPRTTAHVFSRVTPFF